MEVMATGIRVRVSVLVQDLNDLIVAIKVEDSLLIIAGKLKNRSSQIPGPCHCLNGVQNFDVFGPK